MSGSTPGEKPSPTTTGDEKSSSPSAHWRRRARGIPLPPGHAARQGDITSLAFRLLGKEPAIAFLNTDNPKLGARPIAHATESDEGKARVEAELHRIAAASTDTLG